HDIPEKLYRYWKTRYSLFSLYDSGVALNEEQWFSVTPEAVAVSVAEYLYECQPDAQVIVDGFCGAGGNSIQFARLFPRVISIEIDPVTMACAKQNARVYGVEDKIEFILGDVFEVLKSLIKQDIKVDIIYASPPWGGPSYLNQSVFDLSQMVPYDLQHIYSQFSCISKNICLFLPKSSDLQQIADL
ncbi:S-adenosyl-L-methionine-dependent methyltransferase, partial [Nadsonia fulvescens var. elongata DSM 6958]